MSESEASYVEIVSGTSPSWIIATSMAVAVCQRSFGHGYLTHAWKAFLMIQSLGKSCVWALSVPSATTWHSLVRTRTRDIRCKLAGLRGWWEGHILVCSDARVALEVCYSSHPRGRRSHSVAVNASLWGRSTDGWADVPTLLGGLLGLRLLVARDIWAFLLDWYSTLTLASALNLFLLNALLFHLVINLLFCLIIGAL